MKASYFIVPVLLIGLLSVPAGALIPSRNVILADATGLRHDLVVGGSGTPHLFSVDPLDSRYGWGAKSEDALFAGTYTANNSQSIFGSNNYGSFTILLASSGRDFIGRINVLGSASQCAVTGSAANTNSPFRIVVEQDTIGYCHSTSGSPYRIQITGQPTSPSLGMVLVSRDVATKTIKIYSNGVLASTTTYTLDPLSAVLPQSLVISHSSSQAVYEARVWDYALTDSEALSFYTTLSHWQTLEGHEKAAWFFEPEPKDYRQWEIWAAQGNPSTGALTAQAFTISPEHNLPNSTRVGYWVISATFSAPNQPGGGGTQTFQFVADGVNVAGCTWSMVRTALGIGVGIVTSESHFHMRCPATAASITDGAHTVAITVGGTTIVTASRIDVTLHLKELVYPTDFRWAGIQNQISMIQDDVDFINGTTKRTEANLTTVHTHIDAHLVYQNSLLNLTYVKLTSQDAYTNSLINASFIKTWARQSYTNDLINNTFNEQNLNITLGNFTLQELNNLFNNSFSTQSVPIAESIDAGVYTWGIFFILLALIIWAEWTRETLVYVLAMLAGMIVVFAMPAGFVAYRVIITLVIVLLGVRAYMDFRTEGNEG